MKRAARDQVRQRAGNRCEYCRLRQDNDRFHPFHVEHIVPRKHRGADALENLARPVHRATLNRAPNLWALDPDTSQMVRLFNPRQDHWREHFAFDGIRITGLTDIGRTTAWVLQMNSEDRL